mmetsp:Transcript_525/g.1136  ORF Transcript_525/g.1136 Transcript_525/m.1136 type:complete len:94 (-) Transcript_525:527-808(-)
MPAATAKEVRMDGSLAGEAQAIHSPMEEYQPLKNVTNSVLFIVCLGSESSSWTSSGEKVYRSLRFSSGLSRVALFSFFHHAMFFLNGANMQGF